MPDKEILLHSQKPEGIDTCDYNDCFSLSSYAVNRKQTKDFIKEVALKNEEKALKVGK